MSAIDEKALEAAARALAASDAKNGRDPHVHYSDYRENWDRMARAAITAYLTATSSAADARIARLEEALRDLVLRLENKMALARDSNSTSYGHSYVLCAGIDACIAASGARAALGSDAP